MQQIRIGVVIFALLSIALGIALAGAAAAPQPAPQNSDRVLAEGNPPLTQSMVDHCVALWEIFYEIKITHEQHDAFQRFMVEAWNRGDKDEINGVQIWLKLYGKEKEVLDYRAANQSAFVEFMRHHLNDPEARLALEIYDAAHPERKDFMRAHGMENLVGEWKRVDYLSPQTNPYTHDVISSSFTDTLIFTVFADGHFKHLWVHSHCEAGNRCCSKYSTNVSGTVSIEGGQLVLKSEAGTQLFDAPCNTAANLFGPIQPHDERVAGSIKRDGNGRPTLCLASQPFDPWQQGPTKAVCYQKN